MNFDFFHDLTFDVLYAAAALLTFVVIERSIYYFYLSLKGQKISAAIKQAGFDPVHHFNGVTANDVLSQSMIEYIDFQKHDGVPRARVDDLSAALFLRVDGKVNARLWILDTIVTAAPLLGLLGTILGIMQTFTALAAGGVSDPGEVSKGIGTALLATAVGIGTALYGLLCFNVLHRRAETITDEFKTFLLRTTM